jgi:hypothetical protein
MSVCPSILLSALNHSVSSGQIFVKFWIKTGGGGLLKPVDKNSILVKIGQ